VSPTVSACQQLSGFKSPTVSACQQLSGCVSPTVSACQQLRGCVSPTVSACQQLSSCKSPAVSACRNTCICCHSTASESRTRGENVSVVTVSVLNRPRVVCTNEESRFSARKRQDKFRFLQTVLTNFSAKHVYSVTAGALWPRIKRSGQMPSDLHVVLRFVKSVAVPLLPHTSSWYSWMQPFLPL